MAAINKEDLQVFADLGTDFDEHSASDGTKSFHFTMASHAAIVSLLPSEKEIRLSLDGKEEIFSNPKALFGSKHFGDLHLWASNQAAVLGAFDQANPIPVLGDLTNDSGETRSASIEEFEAFLSRRANKSLDVVVIDGPAGIGKTTDIRQVSLYRARHFATQRKRLFLHVESTGRVLQNLDDLIAGSLQKIRAKPTFDQLRVLVRHGLVTIAIDGFDELTDPNGYQLAWGQLRDLLEEAQGEGQIVLSGRETFVSMSRMKEALPILTRPEIEVSEYRLREVEPHAAVEWLKTKGLTKNQLEDKRLSELLTHGSYGLRPFFLSTLLQADLLNNLTENSAADLLTLLVAALIEREQNKFGDDIAKKVSRDQLGVYVRSLCEEIARDMADNQSEALPTQSLEWIAEICLPEGLDSNIARALAHRAGTLPFLTPDTERKSVRFAHRQYLVFFLGVNAVKAIAKSDFPKYLRRNILGSEFLETFPKVLLSLPNDLISAFRDNAISELPTLPKLDRSSGNTAALLLACSCEYPTDKVLSLRSISIDEVFLRGQVPVIELSDVTISTLHAEQADLTAVRFEGGNHIMALCIDGLTRLPESMPIPTWLEDGISTLKEKPAIEARLLGADEETGPPEVRGHSFPYDHELLDRIRRYRPFWLRIDPQNIEPAGRHIIEHPEWNAAREWFEERDLLRVEKRYPASGRSADFVHFRL
ncbi:NACHT domain-containing protein [Paracoccus versutus]|uniref:NACHT domain-containing protein n=1 Tax=Paracoccus versutus TaxID=34007 RepID=UPI0011C04F4D|nr:NACHT domain-containing protein [Paracoccus versutus]